MSRWSGDPGTGTSADPPALSRPLDGGPDDWPESVRVVGLQPRLWSIEEPPPVPPPERRAGVIRLGPEAMSAAGGRGEVALSREIGQSFYLMGLMALFLFLFVGLGMLLVRVLV